MSKEAMKLALEALECALSDDKPYIDKSEKAIKALEEALAKQEQGEPVAWPVLNIEEREALERFNETCEDGQEYDVSKSMMKHLAELGVVYSAGFGRYGFTEFGRAGLNHPQPAQQKAKQEQGVDWKDMYEKEKRRSAMWIAKYEKDIGPLEYAVPAKQEQGEPVAWMYESVCGNDFATRNSPPDYAKNIRPLGYTTPQQHKPLTDEQPAWLCNIETADFEQDTITLKMLCGDYKVSAGLYSLSFADEAAHGIEPQAKPDLSPAPCNKCGYNGAGYYQPDQHKCAAPKAKSADAQEHALVTAARKVMEELGTSTDGLQEMYQALKLYTTPPAAQLAKKELSVSVGEPVGHLTVAKHNNVTVVDFESNFDVAEELDAGRHLVYTTPQPCQTCEALARTVMLDQSSHDTTPQQRTWVGLTDDEFDKIYLNASTSIEMLKELETKLKEKNT